MTDPGTVLSDQLLTKEDVIMAENKNINAVVYARVSTDEQAKGYSLGTQIDACRKYAIEHGYTVVSEFSEDFTGTVLDRPALNRLREFVANQTVDIMIVYDIDRLARKAVYQMLIEEEFNNQGIVIKYVLGHYDDSDEGRLQKQIRASIAEYEKAKIIERMKRGKRGKAKSGYVIVAARPPYGYRKISEPHKAWLKIDEGEAKIVKLIFEWYLRGDGQDSPLSMNTIAVKLTGMRVPTRGDKQKHVAKKSDFGVWRPATVRKILKNETYTGIWYFGKTKMVNNNGNYNRPIKDKRGHGKQVAREREDWIPVDVPAIIDRTDFEEVRKRIQINIEQSKRNAKYKYLLGRRLKCAKCGHTYVGLTRKKNKQYYYCKRKAQVPVKMCDMPNFRADLLENAVWQWVKAVLQNPRHLAEGLLGRQAEVENDNLTLYERLSVIESQLENKENQLSKLLDLFLAGDFPKEILTEKKSELEKIIAELKYERDDLSAHIQAIGISNEQITEIEAFCAEVREGLGEVTFEEKRRLFDLLDLRGKLAIENDEKVVYIKCKFGQQRVSLVQTSPLSNIGEIKTLSYDCPPMVRSR